MFRSFLTILTGLVVTIVLAPFVILIALVNSHAPVVDRLIRLWGRMFVRASGVDLSVDGLEKLDPAKRYVLVPNHASYLDIPCLLTALDTQPIRFMAKASLFKIPILGWGMLAAGFIPIDRKRTSKGKASFDLAAKRIRGGNTIVIFPEGGRSHERTMKPFKHGAFLLAMKSGLPLVPVAIRGTHDALPPSTLIITRGPVKIVVGDPVDVSELGVRQKDELVQATRAKILEMLGQTEEASQMRNSECGMRNGDADGQIPASAQDQSDPTS
jgi:1-acyl-sn-glycerol-3-phosphate acyltransferase